jgi:hypothetical protein
MGKIKKSIKGRIIDGFTNKPIKGVKIQLNDMSENKDVFISIVTSVKTDVEGNFILNITYLEENPPIYPLADISCTNKSYGNQKLTIFKGNGDIIEDLGITKLNPIKSDLTADKIAFSLLTLSEVSVLTAPYKDADFHAKKLLTDAINTVKSQLIGKALNLIAEFGVTDIQSLIKNPILLNNIIPLIPCPTSEVLNDVIKLKNQLVTALNKIMAVIDNTTKFVGITGKTLSTLDTALKVAINLPVPIPPNLPMNVVTKVQQLAKKLEGVISKSSKLIEEILVILLVLKSSLQTLISILNILDKLIQHCYTEIDQARTSPPSSTQTTSSPTSPISQLSSDILIPINASLILSTNQVKKDQDIVDEPQVVNGFTFDVETEITESKIKRRRAIAKSSNGTVLLRGDFSFSSIDRILIDELIFYIQQNNLQSN